MQAFDIGPSGGKIEHSYNRIKYGGNTMKKLIILSTFSVALVNASPMRLAGARFANNVRPKLQEGLNRLAGSEKTFTVSEAAKALGQDVNAFKSKWSQNFQTQLNNDTVLSSNAQNVIGLGNANYTLGSALRTRFNNSKGKYKFNNNNANAAAGVGLLGLTTAATFYESNKRKEAILQSQKDAVFSAKWAKVQEEVDALEAKMKAETEAQKAEQLHNLWAQAEKNCDTRGSIEKAKDAVNYYAHNAGNYANRAYNSGLERGANTLQNIKGSTNNGWCKTSEYVENLSNAAKIACASKLDQARNSSAWKRSAPYVNSASNAVQSGWHATTDYANTAWNKTKDAYNYSLEQGDNAYQGTRSGLNIGWNATTGYASQAGNKVSDAYGYSLEKANNAFVWTSNGVSELRSNLPEAPSLDSLRALVSR